MVALPKVPEELREALIGKGRVTITGILDDKAGHRKDCIRFYFEFYE